MLVITVRHVTTYLYKQPVAFGEHRMMLRPRDSYDQKLLDATLAITPEPIDIRWVHDVFGNCVAIARFAGWAPEFLRHDGRTDTSELLAQMTHAIHQDLTYVAREETGVQDPVKTLQSKSG